MSSDQERMHILQMIGDGKISAAEGLRLLNALPRQGPEASAGGAEPAAKMPPPRKIPADVNLERLRRWWLIPMWIGVGLTVVGGLLMYWAFQASGLGFWFFCAWLPFLLGVLVMALAWPSPNARWIHVRVKTGQKEWPQSIALSFPLPLQLTAWLLRTFGKRIPQLQQTGMDELIMALGESATPETPLFVDVNEGEGGEQVQVYIG